MQRLCHGSKITTMQFPSWPKADTKLSRLDIDFVRPINGVYYLIDIFFEILQHLWRWILCTRSTLGLDKFAVNKKECDKSVYVYIYYIYMKSFKSVPALKLLSTNIFKLFTGVNISWSYALWFITLNYDVLHMRRKE